MSETAMVKTEQEQQQHQLAEQQKRREAVAFTPRFDILENEDKYVLFGDFPGVKADDLEVQFEKDELVIRGKCEQRDEQRPALLREYRVGDFQRSFRINDEIDAERIEAHLRNGVLQLTLPKSESAKPRKIEVKTD